MVFGNVLNFFLWWYTVLARQQAEALVKRFVFLLVYTNTLPMAQNLGKPLFQDNSDVGVAVGWIIRFIWIWLGGMFSLVLLVPFSLKFLGYVFLPPLALGMLIFSVVRVFLG
jgi:hypothetical protein